MSDFPAFLTGRHVERAVIDTCVKWGAEFIADAERQFTIQPHAVPVPDEGQFTTTSSEFEKFPEDQTPAVLIIAPGLAGEPRQEADRSLTAPVALGVGILVSTGHGVEANRDAAQILAGAYCELLLRMPLEGLDVDSIEYIDERYTDIPGRAERTLAAARLVFTIWVRNWRSLKGGPPDRSAPRPDPYPDPGPLPRVSKTFVSINNVRSIDG